MLLPDGICSTQIKKKDNFKRSPIHFACAGGNLSIIRQLEQAGFSLTEVDSEGCAPCHYAAMTGNLDSFKYLWMKGVDVVTSTATFFHMTPLHIASLYGNLNIVKFLCEQVVDARTPEGDSEEEEKCITLPISILQIFHSTPPCLRKRPY